MPLNNATIKTAIKAILDANNGNTGDNDTNEATAGKLATAIENAIKSATVNVNVGSGDIKVTGTAAAQQNPAPIPLTGTLS